jgi:hypothetical protein
MRLLTALLSVTCLGSPLLAQGMTPQERHDRIVAVLKKNVSRPLPAGDTLVTWSPIPNVYTTVSRHPGGIESSFIRADAMVGTAAAAWDGNRQSTVHVLWTQGDSTVFELRLTRENANLRLTGSRTGSIPLPSLPWVIADYGMEDQSLPLFESLDSTTTIVAYRPYLGTWDTMVVQPARNQTGAKLVTIRDDDGETWRWVISPNGKLVRIIRSRFPNVERRPLDLTSAMAAYEQYGSIAGSF